MSAPSLLFRRTGGEDFPDRLKCLISGPPKSGKTSLLGTVPNIVIADTEPHANNLQSIAHLNVPYVTVNSSMDLQRLLMVLRDDTLRAKAAAELNLPDIEAVGIDTLDSLQKIMKRERMREQRTSKFLRDDWGWLKEEMTSILSAFTALPLHVFFVVHVKTKDIGSEDDPNTIVLPGLEGALSEDIAGMVGYSLLSFRRQELRADGSPYTKYWLRAEGDDTYQFLGNRAAGRLPDVIEPNFKAIYNAAMAGRSAMQAAPQPASVGVDAGIQQSAQTAPPEAAEQVAQSSGHPAPATQQATPAGQPAQKPPDDDEPVNANALSYCKKVYDAAGLEFPEETIRGLTLGQARQLVKYWQAVQQDAVEGKLEKSPSDEMASYLADMGWLATSDGPGADEGKQAGPTPDRDGTIEQVLAYIGGDLAKAQEVYDLEMAKPKPRVSLINQLTNLGVTVQTPVQNQPTQDAAPEAGPEVTPEPAGAEDDPTEQQAMVTLQEQLGAVPVDESGTPLPCEVCGKAIDDEDIATLSKSRFNKRLCVQDYIAETKKTHA